MMQSGLRNHLGGTKPEFLVSWVPGFQGSVVVTDAKVREATGAHPPIADSSLACGQPRRRLRGKSAGGPCPSVASAFPGHTPGAGSSTACARPPRHRLSLHYRRLLRKGQRAWPTSGQRHHDRHCGGGREGVTSYGEVDFDLDVLSLMIFMILGS